MFKDENQLWALFWTLVAIVIVTIVVAFGINIYNRNNLIASSKTCEQAVIMTSNNDDSTIHLKIAACRGQIPTVVKTNSATTVVTNQ